MTSWICDAEPPSGFWRRDTAHYPSGITRHLWELITPDYDAATRQAFARYGCTTDHIDLVRIRGRVFNSPVFVADELELQKRNRTADRAIADKLWRVDRAAWPAIRNEFHRQLMTLSRRSPGNMAPEILLEHLGELRIILHNGTQTHFTLHPASTVPVGDWLRETCENLPVSVSDIALVLRRQVHPADFLQTLDVLVEQIRGYRDTVKFLLDSPDSPTETLNRLKRISPDLAHSLQEYLIEFGDRVVTGFDLTDATLRELPGAFLAVLRCRLDSPPRTLSKLSFEKAMETLRQYIPAEHREVFENGLEEAAAAYGLHDEDVRITHLWPLGLMRRAMLAAAAMLLSRGAIVEADHVFHTTPSELDALLAGNATAPSCDELVERAAEWDDWSQWDAPLTIGMRDDQASSESKPRKSNRIDQATNFYLSLMESRQGTGPRPEWILVDGIAASPGRYEGPARVIREPTDFSKLKQGDVLVSRITSPEYNLVMPLIGAVVTDRGGALCHSAIVAREFGIPAVVGADQATALIPDGARVLVDGDRGFVSIGS